MNFDVRIQALDKLFEINNDVAAYWSKADQLLEEMEHATEGVEDGMVFYLASRAIEASYLDESFYATRRLVDKYEALITETCYHGHPPLEVHKALKEDPSLYNQNRILLLHTYRTLQFAKFKGASHSTVQDLSEVAIEAGAWHLFLLASFPRSPLKHNPGYPLNADTVLRLQRNYQTMVPHRDGRWEKLIARCTVLLNSCGYINEARALEVYMDHEKASELSHTGKIFWPELQNKQSPEPKKSGMSAKSDIPFTSMGSGSSSKHNDAAPEHIEAVKAAASKGEDEGSGIGCLLPLGALVAGLIWYFVF